MCAMDNVSCLIAAGRSYRLHGPLEVQDLDIKAPLRQLDAGLFEIAIFLASRNASLPESSIPESPSRKRAIVPETRHRKRLLFMHERIRRRRQLEVVEGYPRVLLRRCFSR